MNIKKIEQCPLCQEPLIFVLVCMTNLNDPQHVPDRRDYVTQCLDCGAEIQRFNIDNTLKAVKDLKDSLDRVYGKSFRLPVL